MSITAEAPTTKSRFKQCPDCLGEFEVPYLDGIEYGGNTGIRDAVDRFFSLVICDRCSESRTKNIKEHRIRTAAEKAKNESFHFGWMMPDAKHQTFEESNPNIEIRDDETFAAYQWGKAWTPGQEKHSAWISGPHGTGKSFLARCVLNRALSFALHSREITALQIQQWAHDYREGPKKLRYVKTVGALLIEEIGVPYWRDEGVIALREIIDYRYRHRLATLITSNNDPESMRSIWCAACSRNTTLVASMLDRMGDFVRLTLDGKSLRRVTRETDRKEIST